MKILKNKVEKFIYKLEKLKNIITIVVARQDIHKGSRHYWDPEYNKTFKLLDTPIITDNNGIKITVLKTVENLESKFDKGIYGKM